MNAKAELQRIEGLIAALLNEQADRWEKRLPYGSRDEEIKRQVRSLGVLRAKTARKAAVTRFRGRKKK